MPPASEQTETEMVEALLARARSLQEAAGARRPTQPRLVTESARCMARHLGMTEERMRELVPEFALWQLFLPAALAADMRNFSEADARMPSSFRQIHQGLAALECHRQVVVAAFHMAGMPLVWRLGSAAWEQLHDGPRHMLLASRNLAWTEREEGRWMRETGDIVGTEPAELRRLMTGLRNGSIRRLAVLVDGPHAPGRPGTRALANLSPALGFKTGLLRAILALGIPVIPLAHWWEANRLILKWHPRLSPATRYDRVAASSNSAGPPEAPCHPAKGSADGISEVAGIIEDLLRSHPEQWLNWPAASLRT